MATWLVFQIVSRRAGTMTFEVLDTVKAQTAEQALDKWAKSQKDAEGMKQMPGAIEWDQAIIQAMPDGWLSGS